MKILVVDNFDSFTYNLVHYIEQFTDVPVVVKRNHEIKLAELESYDKIVLSPGPGLPNESINLMAITEYCIENNKPLLGVCLGLQAIVECMGGKLLQLNTVLHGTASLAHLTTTNNRLFTNISSQFKVGHYHSWAADPSTLSKGVEVLATDQYNNVMAIKLKSKPVYGVQFHPESVLTPDGLKMIENWVARC
ncbi:MAG: aminodeoxychorismate/anthranilate synthase component II [Flavobacteriales bacterium]|nr:aminodeoxychorismate/anthranilate synthase component II [Flavobacteriales bacterium]